MREIFTDFHELHGDRMYADDQSIIGGPAASTACPAWSSATRRAATRERAARNFGMPRPGYRKALRLMRLAEKFNPPVFTFVDTPGAYPGIGAEERGQSEAIGHNLYAMAELKVPVIVTIIGEGGSGGARWRSPGNAVLMLQYATYAVIRPKVARPSCGAAPTRRPRAAEALAIIAPRLKDLGLVDRVVNEPVGGAHRDPRVMARLLRRALGDALRQLQGMTPEQLVEQRIQRLLSLAPSRKCARDPRGRRLRRRRGRGPRAPVPP